MAVGVLEHGVAAPQGGQRRQRRAPGPRWWPMSSPARSSRWPQGAAGPVAQRRRPRRPGGRPALRGVGQRRAGRAARRAPCLLAVEPAARARRAAGRARMRHAAPLLGARRARPAWRRRSGSRRARRRPGRAAGVSGSWPIAETTGVRHRVHRPDQRLVGERQQVLDRAAAAGDHDHVDRRVAVEPLDAPRSPRRPSAVPCMRGVRRPRTATAGQRRRAFSSDVALGGGARAR